MPSDYASLAITELPKTGGDTLWASAYEAYDRLSPALQQTLEGLTAVHSGDHFHKVAERAGKKLRTEVRGNPLNVGDNLDAVHPVIRTNPVTGWKGLFVNPVFTRRIVELTKPESDALLAFLYEHITGVSWRKRVGGVLADGDIRTTTSRSVSAGLRTPWPSGTTAQLSVSSPHDRRESR